MYSDIRFVFHQRVSISTVPIWYSTLTYFGDNFSFNALVIIQSGRRSQTVRTGTLSLHYNRIMTKGKSFTFPYSILGFTGVRGLLNPHWYFTLTGHWLGIMFCQRFTQQTLLQLIWEGVVMRHPNLFSKGNQFPHKSNTSLLYRWLSLPNTTTQSTSYVKNLELRWKLKWLKHLQPPPT